MKFSRPTRYQTYLLGVCAVVFILTVGSIRGELGLHNGTKNPELGISSLKGVSISVSASSSSSGASVSALLPPDTAESVNATNSSAKTTVIKKADLSSVTSSSPLDDVTAESYLVGDLSTGKIYLSKDISRVNGLASISKLFTAIVAQENMYPDQVIQITPAMLAVYPNSYDISLGEKFTLHDLLYAMLLQSNDNVAEGIAMAYSSPSSYITAPTGVIPSESAFIDKMNGLAALLGLSQTHFEDASGLSDGNVTSAKDLFKFAQYIYQSQPELLHITKTYSYEVATTTDHFGHDFINIDPFARNSQYIGGKTGRTDAAGETMLSIFDYKKDGVDHPIVVIVLHSDITERRNDSMLLYLQTISMIDNQK